MASRSRFLQVTVAVLTALAAGCVQSPSPTNPEVFVGRYADNTSFQPFKNTSGANVTADATVCYPDTALYCPDGGASVRVTVPGPGDPANAFAGGAFGRRSGAQALPLSKILALCESVKSRGP